MGKKQTKKQVSFGKLIQGSLKKVWGLLEEGQYEKQCDTVWWQDGGAGGGASPAYFNALLSLS